MLSGQCRDSRRSRCAGAGCGARRWRCRWVASDWGTGAVGRASTPACRPPRTLPEPRYPCQPEWARPPRGWSRGCLSGPWFWVCYESCHCSLELQACQTISNTVSYQPLDQTYLERFLWRLSHFPMYSLAISFPPHRYHCLDRYTFSCSTFLYQCSPWRDFRPRSDRSPMSTTLRTLNSNRYAPHHFFLESFDQNRLFQNHLLRRPMDFLSLTINHVMRWPCFYCCHYHHYFHLSFMPHLS